ncbi:MAG: aminotransferase class V-fold PLP-dependent enzyme [Ignavibacteriales bacterium]|nr:MAG: aminotransferase class V-fold PLP-dependent enzyme [Ignavibacteriales bacterium]
MNIKDSRKYFPFLNSGMIYMNHAAISPLPSPVVEAINNYIKIRSETEVENFPDFLKLAAETKILLSQMINSSSADRIAFVENTSNGLNILTQGLTWKQDDRIILNDIEFPSNVYPFLNLKSYGVEIDFVKSKDGKVTVEDIEAAITPNTKLVSISFVQFLSGYRIDLERLGKLCKSKEIIFCVDSIQGLGALQLDVQKCKIDFLSNGGHKWLMGLEGLGFIYLTEELQEKINPKYVGWTSVADAWNLLDFNLTLRKSADCFQNGTLSSVGIAALNASQKFRSSLGYDKIEETILNNSEYFITSLGEIGFTPLLQNVKRENLSGIVSFKSKKANEIFNALQKENIIAAVREGVVRLSPHFYNTREEIDKVISVLTSIIS